MIDETQKEQSVHVWGFNNEREFFWIFCVSSKNPTFVVFFGKFELKLKSPQDRKVFFGTVRGFSLKQFFNMIENLRAFWASSEAQTWAVFVYFELTFAKKNFRFADSL